MPCNSDYLAQNGHEAALQETAELLEWVMGEMAIPVPGAVSKAAQTCYCTDDFVPQLCALLRSINSNKLAILLGRNNKMGRQLKAWHEDHIKADDRRKVQDERRRAAANKLTPEERRLLGVPEP